MSLFKGIMLILLLGCSLSTQESGINATTTSIKDSTIMAPTTLGIEHNTVPSATSVATFISQRDFTDNVTRTTATEITHQSSKTFPTSLYTLLSQTSHRMNHTAKPINQSSTDISSISLSSELPTISSTMPSVSEIYTATTYSSLLETTSDDFNTVSKNTSLTTAGLPTQTEKNDITLNFTNNPPTASTVLLSTRTNNVTIELQTRSLPSSFTEAREHQKENHNKGGVIFGAIVGAVLGSALVVLIGYFICGKRKSDSFAHQRLYDNVRNDPVLRLDNTPEPYEMNLGDFSYYSPTVVNEALAQDSTESPCDVIAMDDMTSSHHSSQHSTFE